MPGGVSYFKEGRSNKSAHVHEAALRDLPVQVSRIRQDLCMASADNNIFLKKVNQSARTRRPGRTDHAQNAQH